MKVLMPKSSIPESPSRKEYMESESYAGLAKANAAPIFGRDDPFGLFTEWMSDARASEVNDSNAMSLATIDKDGMPDVRIVLLKGVDERGFVFYSNTRSQKGRQIADSQTAALCLHWKSLRRQVRVRGAVVKVTGDEADAYFASRARGSQIGAWASDQSEELDSRKTFEDRLKDVEARYEGQTVPRPPHWHGWRIVPNRIEFWRDRPFRLHDRLLFTRESVDTAWRKERLFP